MTHERDHGGNMDAAMAEFGGTLAEWLDLSTGINPTPYPVPELSHEAWAALPTRGNISALEAVAKSTYACPTRCLPTAGAQAGIQMLPRVLTVGKARVIAPTYNEHAASLRSSGWEVTEVDDFSGLEGADLAVVVNPNNPNGNCYSPSELLQLSKRVGFLLVDESFADPHPELSIAPYLSEVSNVAVLRSFGKFYGLAGVRLGFVLGPDDLIAKMQELCGPWPISGAAIEIGKKALADTDWQRATTQRLEADQKRLDALCEEAGWATLGGTTLFRLYETSNAQKAQIHLAKHKVWSRIFPYSSTWIRLGLPPENRWDQLKAALPR